MRATATSGDTVDTRAGTRTGTGTGRSTMALRVLSVRDRGALAWPVPLVRTAARALFLRPRPTRCDFSHPALL